MEIEGRREKGGRVSRCTSRGRGERCMDRNRDRRKEKGEGVSGCTRRGVGGRGKGEGGEVHG